MEDDFIYSEGGGRRRITQMDGVRTTVCENRFEILALPDCDVREKQAVDALRLWIRERHKKLRTTGDLSEQGM